MSLQKADKGIAKMEKEEKQVARIFRIWNALKIQRILKGKWK